MNQYHNIPVELQSLKQWVLWNSRKEPFQPSSLPAKADDPTTWSSYQDVFAACQEDGFRGIGFEFAKDDPYVGIDFDNCFPISADLDMWLLAFESYCEISQSGKGIHVILRAQKGFSKCQFATEYVKTVLRCERVEIYAQGRYFALTGNLYRPELAQIRDGQALLNAFYAALQPAEPQPQPAKTANKPVFPSAMSDRAEFVEAVLTVLRERGAGLFETYEDFLRLAMACKVEGVPFETFDTIVRQSPKKYDQPNNFKIYEKLTAEQVKAVTFGTAYKYAEQADAAYLHDLLSQHGKAAFREKRQEEQEAYWRALLNSSPAPAEEPPALSDVCDPPLPEEAMPAGAASSAAQPHVTPPAVPEWGFWDYELTHTTTKVKISALKYIDFLAVNYNFRVFMKRGAPTVVIETEDSMEPTIMRGSLNATVKQYVIDGVKDQYPDVANTLLTTGKYFTLDLLEMLPPIDPVKARHSIFSHPPTSITLQTPLIKEQPFISCNEIPVMGASNLLVLMGRYGLGKSQFCELVASQALNPYCEAHSPFTMQFPGGLVLWIDTENPHNHMVHAVQRIAQRICADQDASLLTPDKSNFARLRVERCAEIDDKLTWLLELVESIKDPLDLIILDGGLDMVDGMMNDETKANAAYHDLRRLLGQRQCGMLMTIHTSQKGELDKVTPLGHWGALLGRKGDCVLQIRRCPDDPSIKEISTDFNDNTKNRLGIDAGIYGAIQWNTETQRPGYIPYTPAETSGKETAEDKAKPAFAAIFQAHPPMPHGELITRYMAEREAMKSPVSESTAKRHVKRAVEEWKVLRQENDFYSHVLFPPSKRQVSL
jgi:hypothetical protein